MVMFIRHQIRMWKTIF